MGLLALRLSVRCGVAWAVFAVVTLPMGASTVGYLPKIGPAPLRYQRAAPPAPAPAPVVEVPVVVPPPQPAPVVAPALPPPPPAQAGLSVPDLIRSLVMSPFWAGLCDGLIAPGAPAAQPNFPVETPAPVVTAEMLVEFFRPGEAPGTTNTAVAPLNFTPPAGCTVPSSSATYRSP